MAIELRNIIILPHSDKPSHNWEQLAKEIKVPAGLEVRNSKGLTTPFDTQKLLKGIGYAIIDARTAQGAKNPLDQKTSKKTIAVTQAVVEIASQQTSPISSDWIGNTVEEQLGAANEFIASKAFILYRAMKGAQRHKVTRLQVIRRNNNIAPWLPEKIELAIRKGFIAANLKSNPAEEVTAKVVGRVQALGLTLIHVETIQDIVVEALKSAGHADIAEGYQNYREKRTAERAAEKLAVKNINPELLTDELQKRIEFAANGLKLPTSIEELSRVMISSMSITFSDTEKRSAIILNAKTLVERDPAFAYFAGRILLTYLYEEALDWKVLDGMQKLKEAHKKAFLNYIPLGIQLGRLNPLLCTFNLEYLADVLDSMADLTLDILSVQTLYDRYLIHEKQIRLETPQILFMRVAMGLAIAEKDKNEMAATFYELYKSKRFCSSTPTLFNAGTAHSQLSSCYLYKIDDTIESILIRGIAENGFLSKWAGGLGGSWTAVRGTGGYIKGTNGESQGVIPFLKLHNDQLVAVNQGGKRKGSGCAYLETWHNDIEEFIQLRKNTGDDRRRAHDMNTANWIPDLFMERIEEGGTWTLFRSNEVPDLHETYGKKFKALYEGYEKLAEEGKIYGKKLQARALWKKMLEGIFETGHPWMTFKDACNIRSPQDHCGVIHSSNLCTEITLNTSAEETAVCNLGSINLATHIKDTGEINWEMLKDTISIAVRMLDNVIDINFYPTEPARLANTRHRPIGLGIMGLQDVLHTLSIPFSSMRNIELNDELMEFIAYHTYLGSSKLAKERGTYSSFAGSKWDRGILPQDTVALLEEERGRSTNVPKGGKLDWTEVRESIKNYGMRNSNVLAIAPTATISNIMGCNPCIEPNFRHLFVKGNLSGDFTIISAHLVAKLKEHGLWDDAMLDDLKYYDGELTQITRIPDDIKHQFATVFEIPQKWIVEAAARRGKWIDQAQSLNLYLGQPNPKILSDLYRLAWVSGLKTTYYLRTVGASKIEKATSEVRREAVTTPEAPCESCQ